MYRVLTTLSRTSSVLAGSVRRFGSGSTMPKFGHATYKLGWFTSLSLIFTGGGVISTFIDWQGLYEVHGIWVPFFTEGFSTESGVKVPREQEFRGIPSSRPLVYEERKEDIERFLLEKKEKEAKPEDDPNSDREQNLRFLQYLKTGKVSPGENSSK